jgi:hypothetical protein
MEANGVTTYTKVESGGVVVVSLYDATEALVGTAEVSSTAAGSVVCEYFGEDGTHLAIEREGSGDVYNVTNMVTGTSGDVTYDEATDQWAVSNEVQQIFGDNSAAVGLGAASLAVGAPQTTSWIDNEDPPVLDEVPGVSCDGPRCRGQALSAARSHCCSQAHAEAAACCTNSACWGCCRTWSCDGMCALGDYFCSCGQSGTACSPDDAGNGLVFSTPLI